MNKQKGFSQIALMVIMLVLAIALPITTNLVKKSQENRSKAATYTKGQKVCFISNGKEYLYTCDKYEQCKSLTGDWSIDTITNNWSMTQECTFGCEEKVVGHAYCKIKSDDNPTGEEKACECGNAANSTPITSRPISNLCSSGKASVVTKSSTGNSWTWICSVAGSSYTCKTKTCSVPILGTGTATFYYYNGSRCVDTGLSISESGMELKCSEEYGKGSCKTKTECESAHTTTTTKPKSTDCITPGQWVVYINGSCKCSSGTYDNIDDCNNTAPKNNCYKTLDACKSANSSGGGTGGSTVVDTCSSVHSGGSCVYLSKTGNCSGGTVYKDDHTCKSDPSSDYQCCVPASAKPVYTCTSKGGYCTGSDNVDITKGFIKVIDGTCASGRSCVACETDSSKAQFGTCRQGKDGLYKYSIEGRKIDTANGTNCTSTPSTDSTCGIAAAACTYSYSKWGECTSSNIQRRTYTSSPSGCKGTPVTTQSCTYTSPTKVPTATPTTTATTSKISFKIAFNGLKPGALCESTYMKNIKVTLNGSNLKEGITATKVDGEINIAGEQVYLVSNLIFDGNYGSTNNLRVKGYDHSQMKYCTNEQINKAGDACSLKLDGSTYDFSDYSILAGDMVDRSTGVADGRINSIDFGVVKNNLAPDADPTCGREGDLNGDGVVNNLDMQLVKYALSNQEDQ